jgi:FtsH-binding integral membrane protein
MEQHITAQTTINNTLENARFIQRVYMWMCTGLVITSVVAYFISITPEAIALIFSNSLVFYGLLLVELGAVIYLSASTATFVFLGYSLLNGITFAAIFLAFTIASIGMTFAITAGMFGIMSLYGYVTKTDLTTVGNIAFMGLIGIILASLANLFFQNSMTDSIITYLGIVIFVALTAYDTQKIKQYNIIGNEGTEEDHKESIMGALTLYLDFVNLFLKLLNLFGKRR